MDINRSAPHSTPLWDAHLSREVDRRCSADYAIPSAVLMENAGKGVADLITRRHPGQAVLVLAGSGNNGGDGLVAARWLHEANHPVLVIMVSERRPAKLSQLCELQSCVIDRLGIAKRPYTPGCLSSWRDGIDGEVIIIDAVLGNGFVGELRDGPVRDALTEASQLERKTVVAVDCPSGLGVDLSLETCAPLVAQTTITFGALKLAHCIEPMRKQCGEVVVVNCGFTRQCVDESMKLQPPRFYLADPRSWLACSIEKSLAADAHKFDRGHILIIGGSPGKNGAPLLTAHAAFRSGAGWISLGVPDKLKPKTAATAPDLLQLVEECVGSGGSIDAALFSELIAAKQVRAVVIGPGWTENKLVREHFEALRRLQLEHDLFVVIDAGATHSIGPTLATTPLIARKTVLTPHPGEWRRLAGGIAPKLSDSSAIDATMQTARAWGCTLIYKSATPLIFDPDSERITVVNHGTNTLAKAGSGDVLAGILATHGARGWSATDAAIRAQIVLAQAGRTAGLGSGSGGTTADAILHSISRWI